MLRIVTRRWVEAILASDDAMGHIRRESYYMRAEDYIEDLAAHGRYHFTTDNEAIGGDAPCARSSGVSRTAGASRARCARSTSGGVGRALLHFAVVGRRETGQLTNARSLSRSWLARTGQLSSVVKCPASTRLAALCATRRFMADTSTQLAALRTGKLKLALVEELGRDDAESLQRTDPELVMTTAIFGKSNLSHSMDVRHGGTDGTRFKTTYLTTTTRGDIEFTQVAKDYWAKIGVDVELDVVDQETMMSHWNNHTYEGMAMGELGTDCCPSRS